MGAVLAKFRKEKTTYQLLESLEQNIKEIEEYSISTQAQQKRYVGNFLVISIGLYIIGFIVFYFIFFPPTWAERITYSIPLLIFPMLIFFIKRIVAWYFQRKLNKNSAKLEVLRTEKKKMLEKVMDKETYKVALEILNRFADKTNGLKSTGVITPRVVSSTPNVPQKQMPSGQHLQLPAMQAIQPGTPQMNASLIGRNLPVTPKTWQNPMQSSALMQRNQNLQITKRRTPFPIINQQEKGVLEKMVDYLIGDGPQNRFAMICKECYAHNGMALQEEYEYTAFRCFSCNTLNPSRKSRPVAPKLPLGTASHTIASDFSMSRSDCSSSSSSAEKDSGSDTPEEEEKKIGDTPLKSEDNLANESEITKTVEQEEKSTEEKKND